MAELNTEASASGMDYLAHVAEVEAEAPLNKNSINLQQKRKFVRSETNTLIISEEVTAVPGEIEIDDSFNEPPLKRVVSETESSFSVSEKSVPAAVFGQLLK